MKSFAEYLINKGITANSADNIAKAKKLLINKKLKILARTSGHQYQDGYIINNVNNCGFYGNGAYQVGWISGASSQGNGSQIQFHEFSINIEETKQDIEQELKELTEAYNKNRDELQEKLTLMEQFDLDVFDEETVRISKALDILENTKSKKAKVIALRELLN